MAYQNYQSIQPITGDTIATSVPSTGYYLGLKAITSLPSAASNGNLTGLSSDKFGRIITIPQGPRDLVGTLGSSSGNNANANQSTQIYNNNSYPVAVTVTPVGFYLDITSVTFTNTSGTGTELVLSDGTNGYYWYVPRGDCRGAVFNVPLAAKTTNTAWTVQCWTAVNSLWVTVQYVYNK